MVRILLCCVLSTLVEVVGAQALEGIDRNLLERRQRELQFGVSLYDEGPPARAAVTESSMPVTLLPPGLNPLRPRIEPASSVAVPPAAGAPSTARQDLERLHASQQQRQLQLELQTRELPEPARRQESNTQQLIFERENRAQELGAEILRRSGAATGAR